MKASEFFGGQFMAAADIDSSLAALKINAVTSEVLEGRDGRDRERIILHVDGVKKPVVVNATNANALIEAWGDETDDWAGKSIRLSKTKVVFNGSRIDSIKITPVVENEGAK